MATDGADYRRLLHGRQNSHQAPVDGADRFEDDNLAAPQSPSHNVGARPQRDLGSADWGVFSSMKIVLFKSKLNLLIPCGFLAILIDYTSQNQGWVFPLSLLGIIPLAERLGFATDCTYLNFLHISCAAGGLLNVTFGNATELVISIHALRSGKLRVVQQSLLGSILSNTLLVLGCAFFGGGLACGKTEQAFRKGGGGDQGDDDYEYAYPEISKWEAIAWLAIFTAWISVFSDFLVDAIEDISLGVAIGSSTQISMFVIPFSVVTGWMVGQPMDLNFHLFETASLLITVLVVAFLLQDGTSNCFKGLMLILCYLIVAASFYVYADPNIDGV
ncbi:putative vacuolar cation/proton exchanger 4 [Panicum miliaceum]|uniref:Vacuolar cation/proton exchanger 4 n=1 Tax=Panicum miliaceum TaxID=4540 RepID=A0A3L6QH06_PANMI|nr:putative vacuolar cation/proton exchanger 4 [Panicum miliaceum]